MSPNRQTWAFKGSVLALSLVAASLAVRTAAVQTANQAARPLPVALFPDNADQILLRGGFQQANVAVGLGWAAALKLAQRANARQPLNANAFTMVALPLAEAGKTGWSIKLLETARRRDPHNFAARLQLIQRYMLAEQVDKAIPEVLFASDLRPDESARLIQALATLAQAPALQGKLATAIAERKEWRERFVAYAISVPQADPIVNRLLADRRVTVQERKSALNGFALRADYGQARQIWRSLVSPAEAKSLITDGRFRQLPAPLPFNWKLNDGPSFATEFFRDEGQTAVAGLSVEYFGSVIARVAEQVLVLPPGHYALRVAGVNLEPKSYAGSLRWNLTCIKGSSEIAALDISSETRSAFDFTRTFDVPDTGCAAQLLLISGLPADLSRPIVMRFDKVSIAPAAKVKKQREQADKDAAEKKARDRNTPEGDGR